MSRYNIHLRLLMNENNKWKTENDGRKPYVLISPEKDLIMPAQSKEFIRTDTSRPIPLNLKFRTGEKIQNGDINIIFGPEDDDILKRTRISIPFSISIRKKILLSLMFIIFVLLDVIGNMVLNLNKELSFEYQVIYNIIMTIGSVGSLILLYRKRIF